MKHFARACVYAHFMRMHNYFEKIMSVADTFRSVVHAFYIEHTSAPFIAINLIGFVSSYDSNGAKTLTQRQQIVVPLFEKKKKRLCKYACNAVEQSHRQWRKYTHKPHMHCFKMVPCSWSGWIKVQDLKWTVYFKKRLFLARSISIMYAHYKPIKYNCVGMSVHSLPLIFETTRTQHTYCAVS